MAKDPAFLFYSADFLLGVAFMTDEEVGKYIKILCLLHQHGGKISKENLEKSVGKLPKNIMDKLETDGKGLLFNKRLLLETQKRLAYCESRRKNLHMDKHMESHMNTTMKPHMENENVNENKYKGGMGGFIPKKVKVYTKPKDKPFDPKVVAAIHNEALKLKGEK